MPTTQAVASRRRIAFHDFMVKRSPIQGWISVPCYVFSFAATYIQQVRPDFNSAATLL
jgi:hypothetical protein